MRQAEEEVDEEGERIPRLWNKAVRLMYDYRPVSFLFFQGQEMSKESMRRKTKLNEFDKIMTS